MTEKIDLIGNFLATQYLAEIARENMPQVNDALVSDILGVFEKNGVLVTREKIDFSELSPIQDDYSKEKVNSIARSMREEPSISPLFVSEDYDILDGHHRWLGSKKISQETQKSVRLPIIRIGLPTKEALVQLIDAVNKVDEETHNMEHVVIYPGTFQLFHKDNYNQYCKLRDRFGVGNVYLATSDRTSRNAPMSFSQKSQAISTLYPIPDRMIRKVSNAYDPSEILKEFNESETVFVLALTENQISELKETKLSEKFREYDSKDLKGFGEGTYYYYEIEEADKISLSERSGLSVDVSPKELGGIFASSNVEDSMKKRVFKSTFNTFNETVYEMMNEKFNEEVMDKEVTERLLRSINVNECIRRTRRLVESTETNVVGADDGPATFFATQEEYEDMGERMAELIGYEVIDNIGIKSDDELKNDALPYASFYPTGAAYKSPVDNPDSVYYPFVQALSKILGHEIIDYLGSTLAPSYETGPPIAKMT